MGAFHSSHAFVTAVFPRHQAFEALNLGEEVVLRGSVANYGGTILGC